MIALKSSLFETLRSPKSEENMRGPVSKNAVSM